MKLIIRNNINRVPYTTAVSKPRVKIIIVNVREIYDNSP